jgi:hypothetical protein
MTITLEQVRALQTEVENAPGLTGTEGAIEIAAIMDRLKHVHNTWLNTARAQVLADEHFIGGTSQRTLATQAGVSVNAVSLWLKEYGPKAYLTVRQDGDTFVLEAVKPRAVRDLIGAGRRVAPSRLGLYDNQKGIVYDGTAEDLWVQLASQA